MSNSNNYQLPGKVIWLTGASSGIGEALVHELAAFSCTVVLTARNEEALEKLATASANKAANIIVKAGDVTDASQMKRIAEDIRSSHGAVDILLANAGTHIPTEVTRFNCEEYEKIMRINFFGVLHCIEAVLPDMLTRRSGYLAVVSSVAGYRGLPRAAAYGASKSALTHFLESIRFDLEASNISVTVISPGFVKTPLTDKNDFPMPFLIESKEAARRIVAGLQTRPFEIHFPRRFTFLLKLLRVLPYPLYHAAVRRLVVR